jgi:hypothetical protein
MQFGFVTVVPKIFEFLHIFKALISYPDIMISDLQSSGYIRMYVCVRVCVCMYVCTYVSIHTLKRERAHTHTHTLSSLHLRLGELSYQQITIASFFSSVTSMLSLKQTTSRGRKLLCSVHFQCPDLLMS